MPTKLTGTKFTLSDDFAVTRSTISGASPVSVKAFGAKGDGITDDTAAFAAAIASAQEVRVPAGTYIVTNLTIVKAGFALIGEGKFVSIIRGTSTTEPIISLGSTSAKTINYRIEGLTIWSETTKTNGASIQARAIEDLTIENVECRNAYSGIDIFGCKNVVVSDVTIFSGSRNVTGLYGVRVAYDSTQRINSGRPTLIFLNNVFVETRGAGGFWGFSDGFFTDCSDGIWMDGCHAYNCEYGLTVNAGATPNFFVGLWVANCYFDVARYHNVRVVGSPAQFEDISFVGCQFRSPGSNNVFFDAATNVQQVQFVGCRFRSAATRAININPTTAINHVVVTDSVIHYANTSETGSIQDVLLKVNGLVYHGNIHHGGVASGTCVTLSSGCDRISMLGNVFSTSTNGTGLTDSSGEVTKSIANNT